MRNSFGPFLGRRLSLGAEVLVNLLVSFGLVPIKTLEELVNCRDLVLTL